MSDLPWLTLALVAGFATVAAIALHDWRTKGTRAQQADTELAVDYMRALSDPTDWGRVRAEYYAEMDADYWSGAGE